MEKNKYEDVLRRIYLKKYDYNLNALSIYNCNGNGSCPFSRASIYYERDEDLSFKFPAWFFGGFRSIANALNGENRFKGKQTFENLLSVFRDSKHLDCLKSLLCINVKDEAKVRNTLAFHYFKPLVYDSKCIVDRGGSDICEICKEKVPVGDTYLGHLDVWHGRADIIIKDSAVKIELEQSEDKDDPEDGEPSAKKRKTEDDSTLSSIFEVKLEKNMNITQGNMQALAEGIVNAFCEARRDKSLYKKFIPSILATEKHVRFIVYNCDLDILLFSDKFKIWNKDETLNIDTLLSVWLALNFDKYPMEVDKEILDLTPRADFKKVVGDKYDIYLTKVSKQYVSPFEVAEPKIFKERDQRCAIAIASLHDRQLSELLKTIDKSQG